LKRLAIVTPVLDDWEAFSRLAREIVRHTPNGVDTIEIVAVDDGSVRSFEPHDVPMPAAGKLRAVTVVRLGLNVGHQRAIAVGLVTLAGRDDLDGVVVMDSDGEDRPSDIPALVEQGRVSIGHAVLARRSERSESVTFKAGYAVYKRLFRLLTGRAISFGNFSFLPIEAVRRLVRMPELWNNLAAAITRSRLRYLTVPTVRGTRYAGVSKMNFPNLVAHGLSAMSVYTDVVFVRGLLAATALSCLSVVGMMVVVTIRLTTRLAIPGWATIVFGDLLVVLIQALMLIVATSLMVLASRSNRPVIPLIDAPFFIAGTVVARASESIPEPAAVGQ
jgi:hypothetical protein